MTIPPAPGVEFREADALDQMERIAREIGAEQQAEEARELRERVSAGQFHVACVGQFKRGKSTLINALVGAPVLPTGVVPVTAVPTILRSGEPAARVHLKNNGWQSIPPSAIADFVTEERNPGNAKGVLAAEVLLRSPLLGSGLCLVDTPGLGSIHEANTMAARAFVPHIDAALVVVGADPPISGEEMALVADVGEHVGDLLFVLNKIDRVTPGDRQEAVAFTRRVLRERLGSPVDRIFEVSALAALERPEESGDWMALKAALERLATTRRNALVESALCCGLERLGARLERTLREQRAALVRPVEETVRRLGELRALAAGTERCLMELGPLLRAEQSRLRRHFEEARRLFVGEALPRAGEELRIRLEGLAGVGRLQRRVALETANAVARERLGPWLGESEHDAEAAYHQAMARFVELGMKALERLGEIVGDETHSLLPPPESSESFRRKRGFYFHDLLQRYDPPKPWRHAADRLLPTGVTNRLVSLAAHGYLEDLLVVNASRVEGDLDSRVEEGRRLLEAEVTALLRELTEAAEQASERARRARAAGEEVVRASVAATDSHLAILSRVMSGRGRAA
jgi:predicted GTPase